MSARIFRVQGYKDSAIIFYVYFVALNNNNWGLSSDSTLNGYYYLREH